MNATPINASALRDIQEGRWRIDPERSNVEFNVRNLWGLQTVKGHFDRYDGTLELAAQPSAQPSIELTIEADSLNTNNPKRDEHLRSEDFFDIANHPRVQFVSEIVEVDGERLDVRGQLHAAGKSVPMEFEGVIRPDEDELEVDVTTFVDHRQLGLTWNRLGMMRAPSKLIVRGRLVRADS